MADDQDRGAWADAPPHSKNSAFKFDETQNSESIPELLRDLVHQGSHLAEQQTKLVEAEVRSAVSELTAAIGALAGAGVVAIAGLGVMLMGLSFLVARALPLWAATLIVAAATLIVAYVMFAAGKKKIAHSSLSMHRTRRTLERAPAALSGNTSEGIHHDR